MVKDKDTATGGKSRSKVARGAKQADDTLEADLSVSPIAQSKAQKTGKQNDKQSDIL